MRGGGLLRALAGRFRAALFGRIRYGGGRADGGGGGPAARGGHVVRPDGSTGESGRGSYQGGDSYGGRTGDGGRGSYQGGASDGGKTGGDGARHGQGGGRRARGSEHDHRQEGEGSHQTRGFWGGLRRRLGKKHEDRDWVEHLEDIHYTVEQVEKFQNLPERIVAIGKKLQDQWLAASIAFSTVYATLSGKLLEQAASAKTKMIGVKNSLKERLSPQKDRPKNDKPEDKPAAIPLATDFSP